MSRGSTAEDVPIEVVEEVEPGQEPKDGGRAANHGRDCT